MRTLSASTLLVLLALAALAACGRSERAVPAAPAAVAPHAFTRDAGGGGCRFESVSHPVTPALCETFDAPAGTGNRSGQLNGTLWGVSRALGASNFGQGQYNATAPTTIDACGSSINVVPPGDVRICNGRLAEAQTDNGGVTSLAMYPKQPFDFAGRTGTVVFDVSDDSKGSHRAWPEFWMSDFPVPVPFVHFSSAQSVPRNGFGIRFAAFCPPNVPGCGVRQYCPEQPAAAAVVTVDSAVVVNDYVSDDSFTDVKPGPIAVTITDCVRASRGPGDMNHFELRVSPTRIDVYGTDAGTKAPLRHLATIHHMHLSLTRGLIWLEDVHYNANKEGFGPNQGTHTFTWDNVGFDGPALPRDLAFDVLDRLEPIAGGLLNLGWAAFPSDSSPLTLPIEGVYGTSKAQGALLAFNSVSYNPVTIRYRLNGGKWSVFPWPFPKCYVQNSITLCGMKTNVVPVALSSVREGTNRVQFRSSDATAFFNVDLILRGAGGLPPAR